MRPSTSPAAGSFRLGLLASAVAATLILPGCATRFSPGKNIADTKATETSTIFDHAAATFAADLQASANDKPDPTKAQAAFLSGQAMLDLQCARYLDAVGSANQAANNERQQVNLIGGFTSAIMGLTGSSAKQIAGVATSFSFAASSMDAFTTTFLFSDAAKSVTKIVRESQGVLLDSLEGQLSTLNYAETVRVLTRYEEVCRPAQIRALIDEAVAQGTVVPAVKKPSLTDAEVLSVLTALGAQLGRSVTELQAIALYAWLKNPGLRDKIGADPLIAEIATDNKGTLEKKLSQAFLPISLAGSAVPARWDPAVKQVVAAATPAPAPTSAPTPALPAPAGVAQPSQAAAPIPTAPAPVRMLRLPSLTIK